MMDLSDGLASDARRLAEASGVKLVLDASALPLAAGVDSVELAATGGEDYELLVCGPGVAAGPHVDRRSGRG